MPSAVAGVDLEVYAILRSADGKSVTAVWAAHNTGSQSANPGGTRYISEDQSGAETSAATLVDGANLKQYLVFRQDGDSGPCLCSDGAELVNLDPGKRAYLAGVFPAEDVDLESMWVAVPLEPSLQPADASNSNTMPMAVVTSGRGRMLTMSSWVWSGCGTPQTLAPYRQSIVKRFSGTSCASIGKRLRTG